MDILSKISGYFPSLSKSERKVGQSILANPDEVLTMSIKEFSIMVGVGESTIIRFSRKIGFSGYPELKLELAKNMALSSNRQIEREDNISNHVMRHYKKSLEDTLSLINDEQMGEAAQLIHNANRIFLFAVGNSNFIAAHFTQRLKRMGKYVEYIQDGQLQSINSAFMTADDVAVAITASGNTKEIINNIELAQKHGSKAIVVSNFISSKSATLADIALIASPGEFLSPTNTFTTAVNHLYLLDILLQFIFDINPEHYKQFKLKLNEVLTKHI